MLLGYDEFSQCMVAPRACVYILHKHRQERVLASGEARVWKLLFPFSIASEHDLEHLI